MDSKFFAELKMSDKLEKPKFDKKKWRTQKYSKKVKGMYLHIYVNTKMTFQKGFFCQVYPEMIRFRIVPDMTLNTMISSLIAQP